MGAKRNKGFEADVNGETMTFAFSTSISAMEFVMELQESLNQSEWPEMFTADREEFFKGIPAVISLHTGTCAFLDGRYTGPAIRISNRLISAARGGEILTTGITWSNCGKEKSEFFENIEKNDLGNYEVKETGTPINILQLFPSSLKERASLYKKFEFLTPEEKKQSELKEKLEKLKQANQQLKEKLEVTQEQAKKARDRALELNKWLQESRNELRTTVGDQIQAAMSEVSALIRESENLEKELNATKKKLDGARHVMDTMNRRLKEMSQQNSQLTSQVRESELEQVKLLSEIHRLEEELAEHNKRKRGFLAKLMSSRDKKAVKNAQVDHAPENNELPTASPPAAEKVEADAGTEKGTKELQKSKKSKRGKPQEDNNEKVDATVNEPEKGKKEKKDKRTSRKQTKNEKVKNDS